MNEDQPLYCHYSDLPSPLAYMVRQDEETGKSVPTSDEQNKNSMGTETTYVPEHPGK